MQKQQHPNNDPAFLTLGAPVTAQTVDGTVRTGTIIAFRERVVILSCGDACYVVRKQELAKQGYLVPIFRYNASTYFS